MKESRATEAWAAAAARPGWEVLLVEGRVHRYPLHDIQQHLPSGRCECSPRRVAGGQAQLESGLWAPVKATYLHHAFDGRDLVEMVEAGMPVVESQ